MLIYGNLLMTGDVVLILGGATMCWFSPKLRRNWVLGYGSARSMINDAAWQAANRFAGMALAALALIAMLVTREPVAGDRVQRPGPSGFDGLHDIASIPCDVFD